jgi:LDH2 family malate/lactate/ureidoglycolate dehydrogenase
MFRHEADPLLRIGCTLFDEPSEPNMAMAATAATRARVRVTLIGIVSCRNRWHSSRAWFELRMAERERFISPQIT